MGTCVHFSRSLPSNSWWQTMAGWQVLSRPSAAEGGGRRPAFTGPATQPYSATEVDGWQHKLSRVSQNRAAVHAHQAATQGNCGLRLLSVGATKEMITDAHQILGACTTCIIGRPEEALALVIHPNCDFERRMWRKAAIRFMILIAKQIRDSIEEIGRAS